MDVPEAHNGILEFLLQIGFVGTLFFMFLWVRNFAMALKCMNGPARQFGLSSVLLLIGILVVGVSEEVLLAGQQIFTGLFFIMGFVCDKDLRLARAARRHVGTPRERPRAARAMYDRKSYAQDW